MMHTDGVSYSATDIQPWAMIDFDFDIRYKNKSWYANHAFMNFTLIKHLCNLPIKHRRDTMCDSANCLSHTLTYTPTACPTGRCRVCRSGDSSGSGQLWEHMCALAKYRSPAATPLYLSYLQSLVLHLMATRGHSLEGVSGGNQGSAMPLWIFQSVAPWWPVKALQVVCGTFRWMVQLHFFCSGPHFFSQNDGSWVTTSWKRLLYYTLTYIDMSVPGFGDEMSRLSWYYCFDIFAAISPDK